MQRRIMAVVTGDVNAFSRMGEKDARRLEQVLKNCFEDMVRAVGKANPKGFTNFRGDSWQFVVGAPVMAVRAALFFRSSLLVQSYEELGKKMHTSVAIGFGGIKYLPSESSLAGGGEAYELSGKRLDKLRRRVPGMGALGLGEVDPFLDSLLGVIDALARKWTASQARVVSLALQGFVQNEIRKQLDITQQAVHKHLLAAGWPAVEPALRWTETILEDCIRKNNPKRLFLGGTHAG